MSYQPPQPPQQGGNNPEEAARGGGYNPNQGGYNPNQGSNTPPAGGGYNPQQGGGAYNPQQGGYNAPPPQGAYNPNPQQNPYGAPQQGGYNAPPPPGYYGGAPAQGGRASWAAIVSMITGILSIVTCCAWCLSIPLGVAAIVFYFVAQGQLRMGMSGRGMAIAGLITAIVGIILDLGFTLIGGLGSSGIMSQVYATMTAMSNP